MLLLRLMLVVPLAVATPVLAQGTGQQPAHQGQTNSSRSPVATRPSNSPFSNPIGQGVAPAASANSHQNGRRTNPVDR